MKNIIPFKKEVMFKTKISEVTSISLEHTLSVEDNILKGEFIVSGDYKITDLSETTQSFELKLPFEIAVDEKYDTSKAVIDIDDFYYEIINDSILSISIDVMLDKLQEKLIIEDLIDVTPKRETLEIDEEEERKCEIEKDEECEEEVKDKSEKRNDEVKEKSIFNNFSNDNEVYKTYSVYIVRENDNLDKILEKYNISIDELKEYNDISNLKLGDKLIIPTSYEENQ